MKKNTEKAAKYIWEKYLEQKNEPPKGIPRDPEKEYGDDFKGWVHFLLSIQHHFTEQDKK
ncbi:MAG: hypothetical protein WED10_09215 [Brumimicrobium sp.]